MSPGRSPGPDAPAAVTGGSSSLRAFRSLQRALQAGDFPAGSRLPSERTLATSIGASRTSVREALKALADSGLLVASPHRGWFVAGATYREGPNLLRSFSQSAADRGLTAGAEVISRIVRPATLDEADHLGLAPASPLLELVRLRRMNEVPISVSTSCLPLEIAGPLADLDLSDRSLFEALKQECGIVVNYCRYEVQAAPAAPDIAELLRIAAGSPVLIGSELIFDESDRAVIVGSSTYRGDAYRFHATLFRG
jgi:GntR family transcriptional regulator